ncbi:MAG TPA: uroporphyrinogen-III C-methyltransferase [Candidatus Anaerobiospirillum stercoravium]|nr:uroporphyrinogen-III C-methyltransferase [Candidatus Anaerobiospirillum stercoravium]
MVNNTSATASTSNAAPSTTPATDVAMVTSTYQDVAQEQAAINALQSEVGTLRAKIAELQAQSANNAGSKHGMLWLVVAIALAAAGFASFTAYQSQNELIKLNSNMASTQQQIQSSVAQVEGKANELRVAAQQFSTLQNDHTAIQQALTSVNQNYQTLGQSVNGIIAAQQQLGATMSNLDATVQAFSERNPNDWLLSESYFLVNNAAAKAIFEQDIKAAVWMLTKADELLVEMQGDEVVALREAISQDIAALNNISLVDLRGLGLTLDRAYDNIDQLVIEGYSDPAKRAAAFVSTNEPSENIADWKENLTKSANDFAQRFVEVRRRNPEAATEFLAPEQDLYLRENIKTRILLAKADLAHGDKEAMQANLNDAIKLVTTYFDPESTVTVNTLEMLNKVAASEVTIATPESLRSAVAFSDFAKAHLLNRGN